MFEVGDYIMKPTVGVCKIREILHLDIEGVDKKRLYYLLIPLEDEASKIYVPTDQKDYTLRKVMSESEAWELIRKIPKIRGELPNSDKIRQQKCKDTLRCGDPEALVGIIKELYLRRQRRLDSGKKNTIADEYYFKTAENRLYSELSVSLSRAQNEIFFLIADHMEE